mgnify:CR=1 FL=1
MQDNGWGSKAASENQKGRQVTGWETYDPEAERRERQRSQKPEPEGTTGWETYDPEAERRGGQNAQRPEPEGTTGWETYDPEAERRGGQNAQRPEPEGTTGWETYDPEAERRGGQNAQRPEPEGTTGWETYDPEAERRERQRSQKPEPEGTTGWETYDPEAERREGQNAQRPETEGTRGGETYDPEAHTAGVQEMEGSDTERFSMNSPTAEEVQAVEETPALQPEVQAGKENAGSVGEGRQETENREEALLTNPEGAGEEAFREPGSAEERPQKTSQEPDGTAWGQSGEQESAGDVSGKQDSGTEEQLLLLNQRLDRLDRKFDEKIRTSESQDIMAKTLYAEVQEYKKGMYSDILKPLLLELVQMRNNIIRQCRGIMEKEGKDAMISVQKLLDYGEDIRDVLEAYDVEIFRAEPGSEFDPRNQKLLKKVPVNREVMNKKIAVSLCDGYKYRDRTIMKENVKVYVYDQDNGGKQ